MIRIPLPDIIAKIREKSGLDEEEIKRKIEEKQAQLKGLISKEGAGYIVASELGIKLLEHSGKIKDIYPGMRGIEVTGKIIQCFEPKEFVRVDGSKGTVQSFIIADETGSIRVVGWGLKPEHGLKEGAVIKIVDAIAKESTLGRKEIHFNENTKFIINPEGVEVNAKPIASKKIESLTELDDAVEIIGTIIQVSDLKFFEICPECGARLKDYGDSWVCDQHTTVTPDYSYLLSLNIDDGTGEIRVVLFRSLVEQLLEKDRQEIITYLGKPELFENEKTRLLGEQYRFIGRVKKNEIAGKKEFIVQKCLKFESSEI